MVPLRVETCLIDPGDDDNTYLELPLRNLKLPDKVYGLLPLDVVRRLRDQHRGRAARAQAPAAC